jgi:hypothetical protein
MTSFNEEELLKIERATSGFFKGKARSMIGAALRDLRPNVEAAKRLHGNARSEALRGLVNQATASRHRALSGGANGYGHPAWASASACESWLQSLALDSDIDVAAVEIVVGRLMNRS